MDLFTDTKQPRKACIVALEREKWSVNKPSVGGN